MRRRHRNVSGVPPPPPPIERELPPPLPWSDGESSCRLAIISDLFQRDGEPPPLLPAGVGTVCGSVTVGGCLDPW